MIDDAGSGRKRPHPRPVAAYNTNIEAAAVNAFDRETGEAIAIDALKTYRETIAQHHLCPESKFLNGDYSDRGVTERRHVEAIVVECIGKEANRWEEQFFLGADPDAQIQYGPHPGGYIGLALALRDAVCAHGKREVAERLGVSRGTLRKVANGSLRSVSSTTAARWSVSLSAMIAEAASEQRRISELIELAKAEIERLRLSGFARQVGIDPAQLHRAISEGRGSKQMIRQLQGLHLEQMIP